MTARAARVPLLISAALVLLGAAWLMAVPPGSSFDEPAHYVKAIGVGRGELYGSAPTVTKEDLEALYRAGAGGNPNLQTFSRVYQSSSGQWQARTTRQFEVPRGLLDPNFGCTVSRPDVTGACLNAPYRPSQRRVIGTYTGTYQPYLYAPAGLAIRLANSPETAMRLGRAATLLASVALLIAAVWLLWKPGVSSLSIAGLALAVTPMVLFVSSVLSPSGPEIAAAICFLAGLLRLARGDPMPAWAWAAVGAGGAVLGAARALGPAFIAVDVVLVALLSDPRTFARRVRAGGRAAVAAGAAVAVGIAAGTIWEFAAQPRPSPSQTSLTDALRPSIDHLPQIAKQAVGVFGALDTPMPGIGYFLWYAALLALVAAAVVVGTRRDRLSIAAVIVAAFVVTIVMSLVYREIGPLHGRYALPFLVFLPLWAGEVLLRGAGRLPPATAGALVAGIFGVVAAVQVLAWWATARRFGVGENGGWLFFWRADWAPPLGWWTWVLAVGLAAAAYLVAAADPARRLRGPRAQHRVVPEAADLDVA